MAFAGTVQRETGKCGSPEQDAVSASGNEGSSCGLQGQHPMQHIISLQAGIDASGIVLHLGPAGLLHLYWRRPVGDQVRGVVT